MVRGHQVAFTAGWSPSQETLCVQSCFRQNTVSGKELEFVQWQCVQVETLQLYRTCTAGFTIPTDSPPKKECWGWTHTSLNWSLPCSSHNFATLTALVNSIVINFTGPAEVHLLEQELVVCTLILEHRWCLFGSARSARVRHHLQTWSQPLKICAWESLTARHHQCSGCCCCQNSFERFNEGWGALEISFLSVSFMVWKRRSSLLSRVRTALCCLVWLCALTLRFVVRVDQTLSLCLTSWHDQTLTLRIRSVTAGDKELFLFLAAHWCDVFV